MASLDITIGLLCLTALLSVATAEGDVELTFQPNAPDGRYKTGEYVKIICKVKTAILDLLQVRKDVDGAKLEISTNDFLKDDFKDTNRYAIMPSTEGEYREIQISINKLKGVDSGTIECRHTLLDTTSYVASEEFKVLVPPESVEIVQYDSGDSKPVVDGKVILKEGEDHGLICQIKIAGSEDTPTVAITLDGESVVDRFSKEEEKKQGGPPGLTQYNNTIFYEMLTQTPNIEDNGKTLTCSATMEGYPPLNSSVVLEVHYAPKLTCETASGVLGQKGEIKCIVQMNPGLELASVTQDRNPDTFTITLDNPDHERHHLTYKENGNNAFEFTVSIDEIVEKDFGMYNFEIQNSHSPAAAEVELKEVVISTTTPTSAPETSPPATQPALPTPDPTVVDSQDTDKDTQPSPEEGSSTGSASHLVSNVAAYLFAIITALVFH